MPQYLEQSTKAQAQSYSAIEMTRQRTEPETNDQNGDGLPFDTIYRYAVIVHPDSEKTGNTAIVEIPDDEINKILAKDQDNLKSRATIIGDGWFG